MTDSITLRPATVDDFKAVCSLLENSKLPTSDLNPALSHFFIAHAGGRMAAVMGMDQYGLFGLLRSAATDPAFRNQGLAANLETTIEKNARSLGIQALYLITNTAEAWFAKKGFEKIDRADVPDEVLQSKEFNGLCPSSSIIMMKPL